MTISTRSISSQEPTAPITSCPVHWCCVPSRRTAYTPRVRHGLFPNTNWTRLGPSTESKTVHSSSASRKRPCTFRPRMPKPLSDWRHTVLSSWNSLCAQMCIRDSAKSDCCSHLWMNNHSQKKKGQISVSFKEHCFLQR